MLAMRERHPRVRRNAQRRRDPRHDFESHARGGQRFGFFAAAAEDERIAALQPHHVQAATRALDQHGADLFLAEGVYRFLLADVDALGLGGRQIQQRRVGEVIVEHGVRLFQQAAALQRDQLGIAGSGAYQVDLTHP